MINPTYIILEDYGVMGIGKTLCSAPRGTVQSPTPNDTKSNKKIELIYHKIRYKTEVKIRNERVRYHRYWKNSVL